MNRSASISRSVSSWSGSSGRIGRGPSTTNLEHVRQTGSHTSPKSSRRGRGCAHSQIASRSTSPPMTSAASSLTGPIPSIFQAPRPSLPSLIPACLGPQQPGFESLWYPIIMLSIGHRLRAFALFAAIASATLALGAHAATGTRACALKTRGAAGYADVGGMTCQAAQRLFDRLRGGRGTHVVAPAGWKCVSFLLANEHSETDCVASSWRVWARFTQL